MGCWLSACQLRVLHMQLSAQIMTRSIVPSYVRCPAHLCRGARYPTTSASPPRRLALGRWRITVFTIDAAPDDYMRMQIDRGLTFALVACALITTGLVVRREFLVPSTGPAVPSIEKPVLVEN